MRRAPPAPSCRSSSRSDGEAPSRKDVMDSAMMKVVAVASMIALAAGAPERARSEEAAPAAAGTTIQVSFKLDPRLSGPTYGGERWVSPPTYTGASAQEVVEARAQLVDAKGSSPDAAIDWISADAGVVSVSPTRGNRVAISVKRAGESKLTIRSRGASKELLVKARPLGKALQIEIVQVASAQLGRAASLDFGQQVQSALAASQERRALADRNRQAGEAFLAENGRKEGVVTLRSGVQYKVLSRGQGRTPTEADTVTCNYRGTLVGGAEFASSRRLGHPATLKLTRAIPGLREALTLMPVGSKWQIAVPARLAYGERGFAGKRGHGAKIGPNEALVFEVELLSIGSSNGPAPGPVRSVVTATTNAERR
jgi:FKBP-type peptidyl-prolyl cis-trans isomerase